MPYNTAEKKRAWGRRRYWRNRSAWLAENGPCVKCGASGELDVDHIDPEQKISNRVWSWGKARRLAELAKCQVLCVKCHAEKTAKERMQRTMAAGRTVYCARGRHLRYPDDFEAGSKWCRRCVEKNRLKARRTREKRRLAGRCMGCNSEKPEPGSTHCARCRETNTRNHRLRHHRTED